MDKESCYETETTRDISQTYPLQLELQGPLTTSGGGPAPNGVDWVPPGYHIQ